MFSKCFCRILWEYAENGTEGRQVRLSHWVWNRIRIPGIHFHAHIKSFASLANETNDTQIWFTNGFVLIVYKHREQSIKWQRDRDTVRASIVWATSKYIFYLLFYLTCRTFTRAFKTIWHKLNLGSAIVASTINTSWAPKKPPKNNIHNVWVRAHPWLPSAQWGRAHTHNTEINSQSAHNISFSLRNYIATLLSLLLLQAVSELRLIVVKNHAHD